ncbi:MAG: 30S ribosomal protein S16 [Chloroflexi bacterium]|nr:30S ribosomal protein S16 [Chloroflexota bacterium]
MVKIRLKRMGAKKAPFYRVVVAESTSPRDGRFKEILGVYNPVTEPAEVKIDIERARYWLSVGAQPTDRVARLLKFNGIDEIQLKFRPTPAAKPAKAAKE